MVNPTEPPPTEVGTAATSRTDRLLARLSRRTTSGRYMPEVDGLRFISIMLVVVLHVEEYLSVWMGTARHVVSPWGYMDPGPVPAADLIARAIAQGAVGVYVFFMISGFVLGLPFAANRLAGAPPVSLRKYFLRRLTRIEPPYLLALTAFFLIGPVVSNSTYAGLLPHYAAGFFYLHGLLYGQLNPVLGPAWSLEIEVQFYCLAPVLALVFAMKVHRARRVRLWSIGVAAILVESLLHWALGLSPYTVLSALEFFAAGLVMADLYVAGWKQLPVPHPAWDLVTLAGWPTLIALWALPSWKFVGLIAPVLCLALFIAVFRGPITNRVLTNRWIATIGGMCYSIYLIHVPLISVLGRWTQGLIGASYGLSLLLETVVLVPVVLAAGAAFFVLVERPCMDPRWPQRVAAWVGAVMRRRSLRGAKAGGLAVETDSVVPQ